jgi:hypothetical protein
MLVIPVDVVFRNLVVGVEISYFQPEIPYRLFVRSVKLLGAKPFVVCGEKKIGLPTSLIYCPEQR